MTRQLFLNGQRTEIFPKLLGSLAMYWGRVAVPESSPVGKSAVGTLPDPRSSVETARAGAPDNDRRGATRNVIGGPCSLLCDDADQNYKDVYFVMHCLHRTVT